MQISPNFISHLFASLFLSAAGAERHRPLPWMAAGHLLLSVAPTRRAQTPRRPPSLALDLPSLRHATPAIRAAATSPSPWRAQDRAPVPFLARASALGEPSHSVPLTLSPIPCLETPERRRHGRRLPRRSSSSPLLRISRPKSTPPIAPSCRGEAPRPLHAASTSPERRLRRWSSPPEQLLRGEPPIRPPQPRPRPSTGPS